jgi:predicted MPP superfamily phosphohydrolase
MKKQSWKRIKVAFLALAVLAALALLWGFAIEPSLLTVTNLTITDGRLPKQLDGVRVVYFSDLHLDPFYSEADAERVAQKIQSLRPDIVLFGGDLIDSIETAKRLDEGRVSRAFAVIKPKYGKYAIFGNHDVGTPQAKNFASEMLTNGGFTLLEGTATKIMDGFYIAGTAP